VESIYTNITMNVDRPIARSRAPSDRGVDVKVGRFQVGLSGLTFFFFVFFYCTIVK
jgi:hypothetical protein